jgi:hypothetical protein
MELDLERRAELLTTLTQLKDKQEAIIANNISKLEDCLEFLENIKVAKHDLEVCYFHIRSYWLVS